MLSKACSLAVLNRFSKCNTFNSCNVSIRRCIGSLVLGHCENDCLTKNTLSAIEVAKRYGSV